MPSNIKYVPLPVPDNTDDIASYLQRELGRVSETINNISNGHLDKVYVEPPRPREGDIRYADGSDWDAGQGENLYYFDGTVWRAFAGGSGAGDFAQLADTTNQTAGANAVAANGSISISVSSAAIIACR